MQIDRKKFSHTEGLVLVEEFSKSGLSTVKFYEKKSLVILLTTGEKFLKIFHLLKRNHAYCPLT